MGLEEEIVYEDLRAPIGSGQTVILYSDGLVERRGESIDEGLDRLARAAGAGPDDVRALCDHILREVLPAEDELHDDVTAVLAKVS